MKIETLEAAIVISELIHETKKQIQDSRCDSTIDSIFDESEEKLRYNMLIRRMNHISSALRIYSDNCTKEELIILTKKQKLMEKQELIQKIKGWKQNNYQTFTIRTDNQKIQDSTITWDNVLDYEDAYVYEFIFNEDMTITVTCVPHAEYDNRLCNSDFSELVSDDVDEFVEEIIENASIFVLER